MNSKIKILVDAHLFDDIFQGTRTFLKGLYTTLSLSDSLEIYLVANDVENLEREFSDAPGTLKFLEYSGKNKFKRLLFDIPSLIHKYNIDYAHFQYIDSPIKMCKTIITIHDVLFLEFKDDFSWLYRQKKHLFYLAAKRANILTTDSEYSRKSIERFLNISKDKVSVVKPALQENFFSDYDKNISRKLISQRYSLDKYILYVSRIEPRKNHTILLKSFLELRLWEKGYKLVFVGKKSIESCELQCLIGENKEVCKSFLAQLDNVAPEELIHFLVASSLFVYPSRAEGFGYPPLEAGALGVETLLSDATCLSEFHFFKSRFFDPNDLSDLVGKVDSILEGSFEGVKMTEVSSNIRNSFRWENSAEVFEKLVTDNYKNF